jgi:hypothetical protein
VDLGKRKGRGGEDLGGKFGFQEFGRNKFNVIEDWVRKIRVSRREFEARPIIGVV